MIKLEDQTTLEEFSIEGCAEHFTRTQLPPQAGVEQRSDMGKAFTIGAWTVTQFMSRIANEPDDRRKLLMTMLFNEMILFEASQRANLVN